MDKFEAKITRSNIYDKEAELEVITFPVEADSLEDAKNQIYKEVMRLEASTVAKLVQGAYIKVNDEWFSVAHDSSKKWYCEECGHEFDTPKWMTVGEDSENPLCPNCDTLNINLMTEKLAKESFVEKAKAMEKVFASTLPPSFRTAVDKIQVFVWLIPLLCMLSGYLSFFSLLLFVTLEVLSAFVAGVIIAFSLFIPYHLNREQILYRLTGLSYEWLTHADESGFYLCDVCGSLPTVSQTIDEDTGSVTLDTKCPNPNCGLKTHSHISDPLIHFIRPE